MNNEISTPDSPYLKSDAPKQETGAWHIKTRSQAYGDPANVFASEVASVVKKQERTNFEKQQVEWQERQKAIEEVGVFSAHRAVKQTRADVLSGSADASDLRKIPSVGEMEARNRQERGIRKTALKKFVCCEVVPLVLPILERALTAVKEYAKKIEDRERAFSDALKIRFVPSYSLEAIHERERMIDVLISDLEKAQELAAAGEYRLSDSPRGLLRGIIEI